MHIEDLSQDAEDHFITDIQSVEQGPFDFRRLDPHADTIGSIPELFMRSRQGAVTLAKSYRGFWVGASAVAYDPTPGRSRRAVYTSGNYKAKLREEDSEPYDVEVSKVCAEMDILIRAEEEGFKWIGALVVAATINRDRIKAVTGVSSATLHPCEDCGSALRASALVDQYTPILTTASAAEGKKYQLQSYDQYQRRYEQYRAGDGFEDAEERDYIASEWAYRKDLYLRQVRRENIGGTTCNGAAKETARRKLKLQVMSRHLGFERAA